ncbi:MAG: 4-(cytidine 5'-diphospho)-2-C-methyl-D-erythritol kinase [Propionibacteriaceae bacterium]
MVSPLPPAAVGVRVRAPAKVNLALKVGPVRPDGYHPLATVYQAVALYDEVSAEWSDPGRFEVTVTGEGADLVPTDHTNLAVRAAQLLAERYGLEQLGREDQLGVRLAITKNIPVAGGLAGGSADAAAALLACATLWDLDVPLEHLVELGSELGSDVPFALLGGTAVGSGRGEVVAPALARGAYDWVLAFGHHGLSTPAVYRRFDAMDPEPGRTPFEIPPDLMNALRGGNPRDVGAALVNDLQWPALHLQPRLRQVLAAGRELGAVGAVVSGSGPTCAFLAVDESAAIDLSVGLTAEGVCRTVRRAAAPAHGARVIG